MGHSIAVLEKLAMSGAILETWIISEILKSYWHNGIKPPVYFYRDKDKKEIDLLILKDNTIYPIEIKKTASPQKKAIKHFSILEKLNMPIGQGGLICLSEHFLPLTENIYTVPVSAL